MRNDLPVTGLVLICLDISDTARKLIFSTGSTMKILLAVLLFGILLGTDGVRLAELAKPAGLVRLEVDRQCGPHETQCPDGCCPFEHGYCCQAL